MSIFTNRPDTIDPAWWARASWRARQLAVAKATREAEAAAAEAEQQAERDAEAARAAAAELERQLLTQNVGTGAPVRYQERAAQVLGMLADGVSHIDIVLQLGVSAGSIDMALRRAGKPDVAREFGRLRSGARQKDACPDCSRPKRTTSRRCKGCQIKADKVAAAAKREDRDERGAAA